MNCETLHDVEVALRPFAERVATTDTKGWTTERTLKLAHAVGDPQASLRVVHIAGTSGKTSTSYYMAALIDMAGKKVGLTVSPHIAAINERVQVAGKPLEESRFVSYFNTFMNQVVDSHLEPTYFEFMMVFALWVFKKEGVDYAVVETGFGGRYDSSNICRRADKLCIITDIGYDHTHILGDTLEKIAKQKAGIIAPANTVCMLEQPKNVLAVFANESSLQAATLYIKQAENYDTYLERNFALAYYCYHHLAQRDKLKRISDTELSPARHVHIPGRLERIIVENTTYILDGAHNEQKMSALLNTLSMLNPDVKWPVLLSIKTDKRSREMVKLLAAHAKEVVVSEFTHCQDMPSHATEAGELAQLFAGADIPVRSIVPLTSALEYYESTEHETILVTGSFYMVAEARAWLLDEKQGTIIT